ncbi:hypothetical protein MASR1M12_01110 [Erysipelotrichia bacterium]
MSQQFSPEITKAFTNRTGALVQAAITDLEKSGILPATAIRAGVKVFRDRAEDLKRNLGFASIDGQEILRSVDLIEFPYYNEDGSVEFSRYKPIPQIDPPQIPSPTESAADSVYSARSVGSQGKA